MEDRSATLRECVMRAIADDYENFEYVIHWTDRSTSDHELHASREEVIQVLKDLVDVGYAQAYVLSPLPPHSTPVPFAAADVDGLWFYLTPEGLGIIRQSIVA